jgi:hypothetical protein
MVLLWVLPAAADVVSGSCLNGATAVSCAGAANAPEDVFLYTFNLTAPTGVTAQTYGFGGGINANGQTINPGGFDSLIALFSGTPTSASILMDGGNPIGSQAGGTQFYAGCGPAGMVAIGVQSVCGDNLLTANLGAGMYTLLLSDADFIPYSFSPGDPSPYDLTDTTSGNTYADLASGFSPDFQTCDSDGDCISTDGDFAVDISLGKPVATPEPCSLLLLSSGFVGLLCRRKRQRNASTITTA